MRPSKTVRRLSADARRRIVAAKRAQRIERQMAGAGVDASIVVRSRAKKMNMVELAREEIRRTNQPKR